MNKERLLNVAKALREAIHPEQFDMERHVHPCGTPACAFGHYAAREDLQDEFSINTTNDPTRCRSEGVHWRATGEGLFNGYADRRVLRHFGITDRQAEELFGAASDFEEDSDDDFGGTHARLARTTKTPAEAADYIERFVAEHE